VDDGALSGKVGLLYAERIFILPNVVVLVETISNHTIHAKMSFGHLTNQPLGQKSWHLPIIHFIHQKNFFFLFFSNSFQSLPMLNVNIGFNTHFFKTFSL
jgi:hypothetical protein